MSSNKGRTFPAEPLTVEEVEQLLGTIKGQRPLAVRNRAIVALLWRSGLRISECLALRPSDVANGRANVRKGKGRKQRTVVYDRLAEGYLSAWLTVRDRLGATGHQPLFCSVGSGPTRSVGKPIDSSYVRRLLPKLASKAGIAKRVHAHGFRHTHASELVGERLPLGAIQAQLGHSHISTTSLYVAKLTASDLADQMAAIGRSL